MLSNTPYSTAHIITLGITVKSLFHLCQNYFLSCDVVTKHQHKIRFHFPLSHINIIIAIMYTRIPTLAITHIPLPITKAEDNQELLSSVRCSVFFHHGFLFYCFFNAKTHTTMTVHFHNFHENFLAQLKVIRYFFNTLIRDL